MSTGISLGILEFGYRNKGFSQDTLNDILEYVKSADELGFSRFWLTEHHTTLYRQPWSSPEMLLPVLLGTTDQINIGTGGTLIRFYSAYAKALNFKFLANLYPARLDFGFANGNPPSHIASLLTDNVKSAGADSFYENIKWISQAFSEEDRMKAENIIVPPYGGTVPDLYLLGSTGFRDIDFAVENKLNFCKSMFHGHENINFNKDKIQGYRESFFSKHGVSPKVIIAFMGVCTKKPRQAKKIMESYSKSPSLAGMPLLNEIAGDVEEFSDKLYAYSDVYGVDEFMIYDFSLENRDKINALQLLSEKFGLI